MDKTGSRWVKLKNNPKNLTDMGKEDQTQDHPENANCPSNGIELCMGVYLSDWPKANRINCSYCGKDARNSNTWHTAG